MPIASSSHSEPEAKENRFLYQGKEWQTALALNLYDFHARQYDPATGRFLGVDPQGQFASGYVGMGNQPTMSVDPNGELAWFVPLIIGAVVNLTSNAIQGNVNNFWDGLGYAAVGAVSAYLGNAISTSSIAFSNTLSIIAGSTVNSLGNHAVSGGQSDISTSFGALSVNWSQQKAGYLGKKDNTFWQNFGYGVGAFANLSDGYGFAKGAYGKNAGEVDLTTKNDPIGHNALVDKEGNTLVSVGPNYELDSDGTFWDVKGTNDWPTHLDDTGFDRLTVTKIRISNVRLDKIKEYVNENLLDFNYKALSCSCVTEASNALLKAGVLNLPFLRHPTLLQTQIFIRNYSYTSHFLQHKNIEN